jgi:hypothetical protein
MKRITALQAARVLGVPVEDLCEMVGLRSPPAAAGSQAQDSAAALPPAAPAADPWQSLPPPASPAPIEERLRQWRLQELQAGMHAAGEPHALSAQLPQQQHQQPGMMLLSPATASAAQAAAAGSPLFWQPLRKALPGDASAAAANGGSAAADSAAGGLRSLQASSAAPLHSSSSLGRPASAPSPTAAAAARLRGGHILSNPVPPEASAVAGDHAAAQANGKSGDGCASGWEWFSEEQQQQQQEEEEEWCPFEGAPSQPAANGHTSQAGWAPAQPPEHSLSAPAAWGGSSAGVAAPTAAQQQLPLQAREGPGPSAGSGAAQPSSQLLSTWPGQAYYASEACAAILLLFCFCGPSALSFGAVEHHILQVDREHDCLQVSPALGAPRRRHQQRCLLSRGQRLPSRGPSCRNGRIPPCPGRSGPQVGHLSPIHVPSATILRPVTVIMQEMTAKRTCARSMAPCQHVRQGGCPERWASCGKGDQGRLRRGENYGHRKARLYNLRGLSLIRRGPAGHHCGARGPGLPQAARPPLLHPEPARGGRARAGACSGAFAACLTCYSPTEKCSMCAAMLQLQRASDLLRLGLSAHVCATSLWESREACA